MNSRPLLRLFHLPLLAALAAAPLSAETEAPAPAPSLDLAIKNFAAPPSSLGTGSGSLGGSMNEWRTAQTQISSLGSYLANEDYTNALNQARQYARQATTPELRKQWDDLIAALVAEQRRVDEATATRIEAALKRAAAATLEATKPAQIDSIIDDLQLVQETNRIRSSPRTQRLYNQLSNALSLLNQWQDMLVSLDAGEHDTVRQQLRNFSTNTSYTRFIPRSQILAYAAGLKIADADLASAMTRIDPVIARSVETALSATTAIAIDPVIAELDDLKSEYENSYNTPLRRARDRVDNATNFFRQWQDFLASVENGDERDARQQLRQLNSNSLRYRPVPRAVALKRGAELIKTLGTESDHLLDGLGWGTLAEVRERVAEAQEQAYGRRSTELARIVSELDRLAAARAALDKSQAGLGRSALVGPPAATGGCGASASALADYPAAVAALREAWWFEAMPALTGLADLPARSGDETAADYARRQFDAAVAAADWPRAHRFALVEQSLLPAHAAPCGTRAKISGENPAAALGEWMKAQKFESAAQPLAASEAYRAALAAGAPPALEEAIIARLRALPQTTAL